MTRLSRRELVPAAAALIFGLLEVFVLGVTNLVGPAWLLALSVAVASVLLVARLRRPVTTQVLVAVVLAVPWVLVGASQAAGTVIPLAVATVAVGRYARRPLAYLGIPVVVAAVAAQLASDPLQPSVAAGWDWMATSVGLWVGGTWLRQRDDLERGRDAEQRERTRAAVAEERVRIAREMHDVLAHTVSVMVVQAEAAEDALDRDPGAARVPLQRVHTTGREALREVRGVLAALRGDGEADEGDVPGAHLRDVEQVVRRAREAGLRVEASLRLTAEPPPEVSRAAYRVCQEALTNALRHAGPVPVRMHVVATQEEVTVRVEDDGPPAHVGPGHGLLGMRERVAAVGGSLVAEPRDGGGFRVAARFPVRAARPLG